jgi:hypothetical protein
MTVDPLFYIVLVAIGLVAVILIAGLFSFTRGPEFRLKYSNKLMRARIAAQLVAVLLIVIYVYLRRQGG